jgi:hypothetical protein
MTVALAGGRNSHRDSVPSECRGLSDFCSVALKALMEGISKLGECADADAAPLNVLVMASFRPDGTVAAVGIRRTSARDCEPIDCVRRRLSEMRAPVDGRGRVRMAGADFVLRRSPAPDGNEKVTWDKWGHSTVCTDEYIAVDPQLEPKVVRDITESRKERYRDCYRTGLRRTPSLGGRLGVKVAIGLDGTVSKVAVVENELADCEVVACIKAELGVLRFPRPLKPQSVLYGFEFLPER